MTTKITKLVAGLAFGLALPVFATTVDCSTWAEMKSALESGNDAKLTANVTQDSGACVPSGTVTLDLNGCTITREVGASENWRLIEVNDSVTTLTIDDTSAGKSGTVVGVSSDPYVEEGGNGGCLLVSSGKVVIKGGTFKGMFIDGDGSWSTGGFAFVGEGATLEMNGGKITECGGASSGGAIYVRKGTFVMTGGTISKCSASQGAGVTADENGGSTVTMTGGTIADCNTLGGNGGALYVDGAATVYGGVFTGNSVNGDKTASTAVFHGNVTVYGAVGDTALVGDKMASGQNCVQVVSDYVVGTSLTNIEDKLASGTLTFCPTNAEYAAVGLAIHELSTLDENAGTPKTWTLTYPILAQPSQANDYTFVLKTDGFDGTVSYQWYRQTSAEPATFEAIVGETAAQLSFDQQMAGGICKCVATFVPTGAPEEAYTLTSDAVDVVMSEPLKRQYVGMKAARALIGGTDVESGTLLEANFVLGNVDEQVAIFGPTNLATEIYDQYLFGPGSAGIALSSGWVKYAIGGSTLDQTRDNTVTGGRYVEDPYLHEETGYSLNDSVSLELKFKSKFSGILTFDYILCSREMDQSVSDPFALFVRDCGTAESPEENDYENVAYMPEELNGVIQGWTSNVVVEIRRLQEIFESGIANASDYATINPNPEREPSSYSSYYLGLPNTGWNVFTTKYQTKFTAKKDHIYQIRIVVADLSDQVYDTVVYLRSDSLRVKPNPPTLTGAPGVVKDGVFQYAPGETTVGATIKADRAGNVYFSTEKCSSLAMIQDASKWLCAPAVTDAEGNGTVALPTETGAYYAYFVDSRENFSDGTPFWVAPYEVELASLVFDANGGTFADGTSVKTNTQTRYTYTVDPEYVVTPPEGYLFVGGWYLDREQTSKYAFGSRLAEDTTLFAGLRVKTGLVIEGKDIAYDLEGDGWSYDYGNDDYVQIDHSATQPVVISGSTTNTAVYLYYSDWYGKSTVFDNLRVDYTACTYSPLYCSRGATIELRGTNVVCSGAGISPFYGSGNRYLVIGREDGSDALFLYPGAGADAVSLNGASLLLRGGTYNDLIPKSYADAAAGYGGFDNGDGTWTSKPANYVVYNMSGIGEDVTDVVLFNKAFTPIPRPESEGRLFVGWFSDPECTTPYTEWFANADSSQEYTIRLYAKWLADVVFDAVGGAFSNGVTTCSLPIDFGGVYTLPAQDPTREGFTFLGWYAGLANDAPVVTASTSYQSVKASRIFAKWSKNGAPQGDAGVLTGTFDDGGLFAAYPTNAYPTGEIAFSDRVGDPITGTPVVSIASYAFTTKQYQKKYDAPVVTSVSIPCFVTEIGNYAFYNNTSLSNLTFAPVYDYKTGEKVTLRIGNYAFADTAITNLVFPAGGSYSLGHLSFARIPNLKDVWLLGDVTLESLDNSPFRGIGEAVGGTVFHLSPAKIADAAFVYALTNGLHMVSVRSEDPVTAVDDTPAGTVEVGSITVDTEITVVFTVSETAPWQVVKEKTVSLLYSNDPSKLIVGSCEKIPAKFVESFGDGQYRAKFDKPTEATGFFVVCVGD